jgi:acyl transferase domain-containing protein
VGLLELLKFFRVFPDVVIGHSAGEVAAAYAAGLLTLEEVRGTLAHIIVHIRFIHMRVLA